MNILVYDFEVFKYDTLLGVKKVNEDGSTAYYQTWDLDEIRNFYKINKDALWVGHNNIGYDAPILEAIVKYQNPYEKSKQIVRDGIRSKCKLSMQNFDTMRGFYSLKMTEYVVGKKISETQVDFDLDRHLTESEKQQTEEYNRDDLDQTYENFIAAFDIFELRLEIMKEFKLDKSCLNITGTHLASRCLGAKAIPGIEHMVVKPKLYENLQVKNQDLINYYLNDEFRTSKKLKLMICGTEHIIGSGGIHAAKKKCHYDKVMYFDVSGYYNLIMINYNLLPRTMPKESRELYVYMYHEQLRLKKINPLKRIVYKTILLAVFGAMMNEYTDFYDPWNGLLVTITGQLFLVDLLEKLEGIVDVVQSNTDGIMVVPHDWNDYDKVIAIVEEWEKRTGFTIKKETVTNLWQRDVNNYCCLHEGEFDVKGEVVARYGQLDKLVERQAWAGKEALIIAYCVTHYFLKNILPEDTVNEYKDNLLMFQFSCKPLSFDYVAIETESLLDGSITETRLQNVNRVFAYKNNEYSCKAYKHKKVNGVDKKSKIAGLPNNVFVYNDDIRSKEAVAMLSDTIDYQYYIDRAYERIAEFISLKVVEDIKL